MPYFILTHTPTELPQRNVSFVSPLGSPQLLHFFVGSFSFISGLSSTAAFLDGQVLISLAILEGDFLKIPSEDIRKRKEGKNQHNISLFQVSNIKNSGTSTLGEYCSARFVSDSVPRFRSDRVSYLVRASIADFSWPFSILLASLSSPISYTESLIVLEWPRLSFFQKYY